MSASIGTAIITLLICVIAAEAITELITSADITFKFRDILNRHSDFFGSLVTCGYCCSVWVAAALAWIPDTNVVTPIIDYILWLMVIHRFSNIWHETISRWLNKEPFWINKKEDINVESRSLTTERYE